ncbi:MAG TPA: arsenate reductase ArsC [Terriglobales bacterium]|jgi:arsenate reductase|nr:arsenate reductase ArsC [Terriglobales bacterium]
MKRVLFLCTGNSCRSQMAEGWLRHLAGNRFQAASAGTRPAGLHPDAVLVMGEAGVDIAAQRSKNVSQFLQGQFDFVITVCDSAKEACPYFPGEVQRLHWSFADPAAATGTHEQRLAVFRQVRDQIAERIKDFATRD